MMRACDVLQLTLIHILTAQLCLLLTATPPWCAPLVCRHPWCAGNCCSAACIAIHSPVAPVSCSFLLLLLDVQANAVLQLALPYAVLSHPCHVRSFSLLHVQANAVLQLALPYTVLSHPCHVLSLSLSLMCRQVLSNDPPPDLKAWCTGTPIKVSTPFPEGKLVSLGVLPAKNFFLGL